MTLIISKKESISIWKCNFVEISKNLAEYRSENNFIGQSEQLRKKLKRDEQYCKKFGYF